jgi:apolipoprotein N-acyltransferase
VVERHLTATRSVEPGAADVVVWPENVVDVVTFADSMERTEIATEADRLRAPVLVGITEDVAQRPDRFLNAQVVVTSAGEVTGRYDKVRRVPFGEYVPGRALLEALGAPVDEVPTDAVEGIGPAVLDVPVRGEDTMRVAVVISWEVFFGDRARDGVRNGGTMLINPTNGSSYTGTILQTQQVASSRLRAVETGRWVGQVSPTGFSAFVSPGGAVFARTGVSEAAVLVRDVPQRTGRTWYTSAGDWPVEIALAAALVLSIGLPARERRAAQRLTTAAGPPRTRSPDRR